MLLKKYVLSAKNMYGIELNILHMPVNIPKYFNDACFDKKAINDCLSDMKLRCQVTKTWNLGNITYYILLNFVQLSAIKFCENYWILKGQSIALSKNRFQRNKANWDTDSLTIICLREFLFGFIPSLWYHFFLYV